MTKNETPMVSFRCPVALRERMDLFLLRAEMNRHEGALTQTEFILQCIKERLDKSARAAKSKAKSAAARRAERGTK